MSHHCKAGSPDVRLGSWPPGNSSWHGDAMGINFEDGNGAMGTSL